MKESLLADIGKSIVAASALGYFANIAKVPLILSYLAAGIILGPHMGLSIVNDPANIKSISEIGLVLLMFILGLEIDIRKILLFGRPVFTSAVVQIIGSCLLGGSIFYVLGLYNTSTELIYLSVITSLSSTLIVIKILSDKMDIDSLPSQITIGALVLQDVFAVAFLALQPNLGQINPLEILYSLGRVLVLISAGILASKWILPGLFQKSSKQSELMLILAMGWCFLMCGLANALKLSLEMGALIAGIAIASYPFHIDIGARISSLRDFFLTVFFVGLGLQIPVPNSHVLKISIVLCGLVYLTRFLTIFPTLYYLKMGIRTSFIPSINLSQVSEFAIVLSSLGIVYGHTSPDLLSAVILSMVITFLVSTFAISNTHELYKRTLPLLNFIGIKDTTSFTVSHKARDKYRFIFLGFHREGSSLLIELERRYPEDIKSQVLVIDFNPETHKELKARGYDCIYGDLSSSDTLRKIDLGRGETILSTISDQYLKGTNNLKLLKQIKELAPSSKIVAIAEKQSQALSLYEQGADLVLYPRMWTSKHFADSVQKSTLEGFEKFKSEFQEYAFQRNEIVN